MKRVLRKRITAFMMSITLIVGILPFKQTMLSAATINAAKTEKSLENGRR